jgi:hypothetical protein
MQAMMPTQTRDADPAELVSAAAFPGPALRRVGEPASDRRSDISPTASAARHHAGQMALSHSELNAATSSSACPRLV